MSEAPLHLLHTRPDARLLATWVAQRHARHERQASDLGDALHGLLRAAFSDAAPQPFRYLDERQGLLAQSLVAGVYEKQIDRESAYEKLTARVQQPAGPAAPREDGVALKPPTSQPTAPEEGGGMLGGLKDVLFGSTGPRGGRREGMIESAAKSAARSIGSQVGREIIRGVLGSILGGTKRR